MTIGGIESRQSSEHGAGYFWLVAEPLGMPMDRTVPSRYSESAWYQILVPQAGYR